MKATKKTISDRSHNRMLACAVYADADTHVYRGTLEKGDMECILWWIQLMMRENAVTITKLDIRNPIHGREFDVKWELSIQTEPKPYVEYKE
jgi:hypothetical protein